MYFNLQEYNTNVDYRQKFIIFIKSKVDKQINLFCMHIKIKNYLLKNA